MAGQTSGKTRTTATSDKTVTDTVRTETPSQRTTAPTTGPVTATGQPTDQPTVQPDAPTRPTPSRRVAVDVNAATVRTAFGTGDASQSVGFVQHMLRSRGFEPGNINGIADHETRVAYARYQESIGEAPTGLPTAYSLDYLGFDIIG
jgi:hypothetical protein